MGSTNTEEPSLAFSCSAKYSAIMRSVAMAGLLTPSAGAVLLDGRHRKHDRCGSVDFAKFWAREFLPIHFFLPIVSLCATGSASVHRSGGHWQSQWRSEVEL